jgi:hypothetical protein
MFYVIQIHVNPPPPKYGLAKMATRGSFDGYYSKYTTLMLGAFFGIT